MESGGEGVELVGCGVAAQAAVSVAEIVKRESAATLYQRNVLARRAPEEGKRGVVELHIVLSKNAMENASQVHTVGLL